MGHIHRHDPGSKLTIFLCLAMLLCISPMPAAAADGDSGQKLSEIATFGHIGLHYAGENRQAGAEIQDKCLEAGTEAEAMEECCFLALLFKACSACLLNLGPPAHWWHCLP